MSSFSLSHTSQPSRFVGAIVVAIITIVLVIWLAKAFALYQVPTLQSNSVFWIRLPLYALSLSAKEISLAAVIGLAGGGIVVRVQNVTARVAIFAVVVSIFAIMALINIVNIEVVRIFGAPLTVGLLYYSDVLGSENGRTAVLSWIPANVMAALAVSTVIVVIVPLVSALASRRMPAPLLRRFMIAGFTTISLFIGYGWVKFNPEIGKGFWASGSQAFLLSLRQLAGLNLHAAAISPPSSVGPDLAAVPIARLTAGNRPIRNVVVLVLESVAAQYLDLYGGPHHVTPGLSSLAGESLVVRNAYSHAVASHISMVSILSSTLPWVSMRTITNDAPEADLTMLPAILSDQGFRTAFFHSSDTRHSGADHFLRRAGFNLVQDYRDRVCEDGMLVDVTEFYSQATTDACTFNSLREWISSDPDRSFFAVLWTFQQHYPYFRTENEGRYAFPDLVRNHWAVEHKTRYLDAIAEIDLQIRKLVEDLKTKNILDDTLIIVTGDHGESFYQHGTFGHGNNLYEEDVHVPLVLINPRLFPVRSTDRITGHADIAPTILDVLKLPIPPEWQGRSLFRPKPDEPVFFFSAWLDYTVGYRTASRKAVVRLLSNQFEMYDLALDPGEKTNLAPTDPSAAAAEIDRIIGWVQNQNRFIESITPSAASP